MRALPLLVGVSWFVTWSAPGHATGGTPFDRTRIESLVARRLPFEGSQVNCHGTSMFASGVLTVLSPQSNDEVYFSSGCFREISAPLPGDVGFWVDRPGGSFAFHSFTYVDDEHVFEKANPGWGENPFTLLPVPRAQLTRHYAQYASQSRLVWGRYTPSPSCHLTQFQTWLDANRQSAAFGGLIRAMEARAAGADVTVDPADFLKAVGQLPKFDANDARQWQLAHLYHEYLWLPDFKPVRDLFIRTNQTRFEKLRQRLGQALAAAGSSLGALVEASPALYTLSNVATYDDAFTGYLKVTFPQYGTLVKANADVRSLNQRLRDAGADDVRVEAGTSPNDPVTFVIRARDDQREWTFSPST